MQLAGAVLPLATIALIAFLIIRSRFTARPLIGYGAPRWSMPRITLPKPKPRKPPGQLIQFDRKKMDEELERLLREKR